MAKSHNQKAKILVLAQMLRESGENRVLSMQDILAGLMEYGIQAERKSIYDDIEALRDFGMDVRFKRGRMGGYYLAGGEGTEKQQPAAEEASNQENSEENAKELEKAKPEAEEVRTEEQKTEENHTEDLSAETAVPLQMPGENWRFIRGEAAGDKRMKLLCSNGVRPQVQEYFGNSAEYKDKGLSYFTVTAQVLGDVRFFGWLTAMGKDVHILKPKKTAQAYRDYLKSLAKEYKGI